MKKFSSILRFALCRYSSSHSKNVNIQKQLFYSNVCNHQQFSSQSYTSLRLFSVSSVHGRMGPYWRSFAIREKSAQDITSNDVQSQSKNDFKSEEDAEAEKEKEEAAERARRARKFSFITVGLLCGGMTFGMVFTWGPPPIDGNGNKIKDEFSDMPLVQQYIYRTWKELMMTKDIIQMPSREQLLPEIPERYQPAYTLVLELKDVLVHPEWTFETGWRFKKRPGLDFLLQHCAPPNFEIVVYTTEGGNTMYPVIDKMDPEGLIWFKLFRDATLYVNGKHIKELNSLNRDLRKVVMVDWSDDVSCGSNLLKIPRWNGDMNDRGLIQLALLLRTMADNDVSDVRDVLSYYKNFDDPLAAFERFQHETLAAEAELAKQKEEEASKGAPMPASWSPSFLKKWK